MLSVHAHARRPERERDDRFIPLDRAVRILRRDQGPAAASRRRRAIAKLGGYGLERPEFQAAIEALGADVEAIRDHLAQIFGAVLPLPNVIEAAIANFLAFMTPTCAWNVEVTGGVASPPPIEWVFEGLVPRSVPDVARALDPQSWKQCSPLLFVQSHLVDTPASCCAAGPGSPDCSFAPDPNTGAPKSATPLPRGEPFGYRAVFEEFCYDQDGSCGDCADASCDVCIETLLCVETKYDIWVPDQSLAKWASRYDVGFRLAQSLYGEIDGWEQAVITMDKGELWTEQSSPPPAGPAGATWSKVYSHKMLSFSDPGFDTGVGETLKALEDEMAGELAEQACCPVDVEPWGWLWGWWQTVGAMLRPSAG